MSPTSLTPRCYGGETGRTCPFVPTWRVREDHPEYDPEGQFADRAWTHACGRHLHFISAEITGGERMVLVLERIHTDE